MCSQHVCSQVSVTLSPGCVIVSVRSQRDAGTQRGLRAATDHPPAPLFSPRSKAS